MVKIFSQIDAAWRNHVLGHGGRPGTIGDFGCYVCTCATIATACGLHSAPPAIDALADRRNVYRIDPSGTYDFFPDNPLDLLFPGRFKTYAYAGYRTDLIAKALPTKNSFAYVHIRGWSPLWKMQIATHFSMMWANGQLADSEGGVVRNLVGAYGPGTVDRTYITTFIPPAPVVIVVPPAPTPPPAPIVVPPPPAPLPINPLPPVDPPTPPPGDLSVTFWQWLYSVIAAYFKRQATPGAV